MAGRERLDAHHYWRQFPVTAHFTEPGTVLVGVIVDLLEHRTADGPVPRLKIRQDDGSLVYVIATQTRLQAELVRAAPAIGDRVKISYTGEASRAAPGMSPTKEFQVAVRRPGPANDQAAES